MNVRDMLLAGCWCGAAARWTVGAAEGLQARSASSGSGAAAGQHRTVPGMQGAAPAPPLSAAEKHDFTHALLLVRAAVAALALVLDVGHKAAIQHLSQEYYHVAAVVS
jgi:hypothetical protein